ncbi:hypothetical protein J4Q44_G00114030 [Coregonus suidteri]|uniref:Uncharacterized protein n=1 Tax=Coregonus suidteri TaxID=861788 RepID=A0AAN8R8Z7_9TELE
MADSLSRDETPGTTERDPDPQWDTPPDKSPPTPLSPPASVQETSNTRESPFLFMSADIGVTLKKAAGGVTKWMALSFCFKNF